MRDPLPHRRSAETFTMRFWNQEFSVTIGNYPDGRAGEVFVDGAKTGADVAATARDAAVMLSLALQHHVPLSTISHAITRGERGEPASILGAIVDRLTAEANADPHSATEGGAA